MFKMALFMALAIVCSSALATKTDVEKRTSKGCKLISSEDTAKPIKDATFDWSGSCKSGYVNGEGTMLERRSDGTIAKTIATFRDGREDGTGSLDVAFPNGAKLRFRGTYLRGLPTSGDMSRESPNGEVIKYRGPFVDGSPEGFGRLEFRNKLIYEGEVRGFSPSGKGKMTYPDGYVVTAFFPEKQMPSSGHAEFQNGSTYDGELKNMRPHGKGSSIAADKTRYSGEFKDGQADGEGTVQKADGSTYNIRIREGQVERLPGREEQIQSAQAETQRQNAELQRQQDQQRYENAVIACRARASRSVAPTAGNIGEMLARAGECNLDPEVYKTPTTVVVVPPQPTNFRCVRTGAFVNCNSW